MGCGASSRYATKAETEATITVVKAEVFDQSAFPRLIDEAAAPKVETEALLRYADLCTGKGCRIEKTEERAITFEQLALLLKHIGLHCESEQWVAGVKPHGPVTPQTINLYDVTKYVIKPATSARQCSYIELIGDGPQPPEWFISHWWGEAVQDFAMCVRYHAYQRKPSGAYWVCAYANNQHELGKDLSTDPMESSFYKAMRKSKGVFLILDRNATPFTRVWCCFEESMVVLGGTGAKQLLFDIAFMQDEPRILTDGFVQEDFDADVAWKKNCEANAAWGEWGHITGEQVANGQQTKAARSAQFPMELVQKGLRVRIVDAEASQLVDKHRILNVLAGKSGEQLDMVPNLSEPVYAKVDRSLHGIFALAAWRAAVEKGLDISTEDSELPLVKALRGDEARQDVDFELPNLEISGTEVGKEAAESQLTNVANALPRSLISLRLNFSCNRVSNIVALKCLGELKALTKLQLILSSNDITSFADLQSLGELQALTNLQLELDGNKITNTKGLGSIGRLKKLTVLELDIGGCSQLSKIMQLQSLGKLEALTSLKLNLAGFLPLDNIEELGCIGQLRGLAKLHLQLGHTGTGYCEKTPLNSIEFLHKLGQLASLTELQLYVCNTKIKSIAALESLGQLEKLTTLKLYIHNNSISSTDAIAPLGSLSQLKALKDVEVSLFGNPEKPPVKSCEMVQQLVEDEKQGKFSYKQSNCIR